MYPIIEPTGRMIGFAGIEFIATFINGDKTLLWETTEKDALRFAKRLWKTKSYIKLTRKKAEQLFAGWCDREYLLDKCFASVS